MRVIKILKKVIRLIIKLRRQKEKSKKEINLIPVRKNPNLILSWMLKSRKCLLKQICL